MIPLSFRFAASTFRRIAFPVAFGCMLAGCGSVPQIDELTVIGDGSLPHVIGAHGPLTARQSKALLDRLAAEGGQADLLRRHLAVEQSVAETPLVAGNRVQLLEDGEASFRALFAAIRGARQQVNLEYFILEDVESDNLHLSDLLLQKRGEGVAVNIIYDSFGSMATPASFFERLRGAGVNLVSFNPMNPLDAKTGYAPNARDHRKLLVADGRTGIIGGVNLSTDYESHPLGLSTPPAGPPQYWRDTDVQIDGPVVAQLQRLFLAHWSQQGGPAIDQSGFFPTVPPQAQEVVRIIGSTPDDVVPRYYATLLSAIRTAERRIWLSAAYFVPTHQEKEDLAAAARRGVDVRLLLPTSSDSSLALAVQRSQYGDLLEAGVRIFETQNEILHSKTATIDGVWSVIGSSNFDHRSVIFNDEVDAVFLGSNTAGQLERMFEADAAKAKTVELSRWRDRPLGERIEELFARLWQNML